MPIAYRTGSTNVSATTGSTLTLTVPSGAVPGDVLLVLVMAALNTGSAFNVSYTSTSGTTAVTTIDQWSQNDSTANVTQAVLTGYLVVAQGDPGATLTFTSAAGASSCMAAASASYSGVDTSNPISAHAPTSGALPEVTTLACPNATPAHTDCWGVVMGIGSGNTILAAPSGLTNRQLSSLGTGFNQSVGISDSNACVTIKTPFGASFSWTCATADDMQTATVILKAAPQGVHHRMLPIGAVSNGTASPSVAANFNSYSPVVGDLIVLCITCYGTSSSSINTPSGYTLQASLTQASTTSVQIFSKNAVGGDTAPTCSGATTGTAADSEFSVSAFILFDSSGQVPLIEGAATHGGTSGTNTVTSATNVLTTDSIAIAVELASQGTTAATTNWSVPSGWTKGPQETASARAQAATQWIGGPTKDSTVASLFTHSRTSTEQAAAIVIVGSPPFRPPVDESPVCGFGMASNQSVMRATNW